MTLRSAGKLDCGKHGNRSFALGTDDEGKPCFVDIATGHKTPGNAPAFKATDWAKVEADLEKKRKAAEKKAAATTQTED